MRGRDQIRIWDVNMAEETMIDGVRLTHTIRARQNSNYPVSASRNHGEEQRLSLKGVVQGIGDNHLAIKFLCCRPAPAEKSRAAAS